MGNRNFALASVNDLVAAEEALATNDANTNINSTPSDQLESKARSWHRASSNNNSSNSDGKRKRLNNVLARLRFIAQLNLAASG